MMPKEGENMVDSQSVPDSGKIAAEEYEALMKDVLPAYQVYKELSGLQKISKITGGDFTSEGFIIFRSTPTGLTLQ